MRAVLPMSVIGLLQRSWARVQRRPAGLGHGYLLGLAQAASAENASLQV